MLLSLACIAKDEEDMIGGMLQSVRGLVDEVVVVDTGSADDTARAAEELGARVIRSSWRGSFATARNESLEYCRGEWIIFLDADERVAGSSFKPVRRLLSAAKEDGFYITLVNYADLAMNQPVEDIKVFRVFRNRPEYRFSGTIHEQVLPEVTSRGRGIGLLPLAVGHLGYVPGVIRAKNKQARNIAMCEEACRTAYANPLARSYALFNLARECQNMGDFPRAVELYRELLLKREVHNEPYFPIAAYNICNCLARLRGREQDALVLADRFLAVMPDYAELWYLRGTFLSRLQRPGEALASFVRCLAQETDNPRYISRMPRLREMAWLAVAAGKKEGGDKAGHLAALHKAWEENHSFANRGLLLEIVRLLSAGEHSAAIVHDYLAGLPGMNTALWLAVRQFFLLSRDWEGAREISTAYLRPRNRSVFQFLRSIDENLGPAGPVDLDVLRAKGPAVLGDPLVAACDRELAALLFLAGGPGPAPWPALAGEGNEAGDAGRALHTLAALFTGARPWDDVEAVKALYTLLVKYRRFLGTRLAGRLREVLAGWGEDPATVAENFKRIDALE